MEHLGPLSGPFRGSVALRDGRVTPARLRDGSFVRVGADSYVGEMVDPAEVAVRAAALGIWSRGRGVLAGPLAALVHEVDCPWDDADVVLPTARRLTPPHVRVRTDRLAPHEVVERAGVLLTSPIRTAFDLGRRPPLIEAVAAVDALAHRYRFGAGALHALAAEHPGARGLALLRRVLALMNPLAESLMETRTRLGLVLRGVPTPVLQHVLTLPGYGRVRLDLAWPAPPPRRRPLALEYDGPSHRTIAGQNRDLRRDAALDRFGWDVLHVSSSAVLDAREGDDLATRVRRRVT